MGLGGLHGIRWIELVGNSELVCCVDAVFINRQ